MEENKNKIKLEYIVAASIIVLLVLVFVIVTMVKTNDDSVESFEAKQVTAYSKKMSEMMESSKNMELETVKSLMVSEIYDANELYGGNNSVDYLSNQLLMTTMTDTSTTTEEFLNNFKTKIDAITIELNNGIDDIINGKDILKTTLTIKSDTVCNDQKIDNKYCVEKLNARVYIADVNSDKWAVIVHGYMMSGSFMYNAVGNMYIEEGYNVIAPDLRGFGNSDGSVAMGYLESLDIYDWIKDLNQNWNEKERYGMNVAPETIVVHGISLGGATTLQLATNPDIQKSTSEPYNKNLTDLKVKGFIDDCGYTSMSGIISEMLSMGNNLELTSILSSLNIDLEQFMQEITRIAKLENIPALNSFDITKLENADFSTIYKTLDEFKNSFNEAQTELNKYINSNGSYEIPNIDKETIDNIINQYQDFMNKENLENIIDNINNPNLHNIINDANQNVQRVKTQENTDVLEGLIAKALMNLVGVGLTEETYSTYSNVFSDGRKFVENSKVMIIHGTSDTTVPHSNANTVEKNISPAILVHKWDAQNQPHAFVVIGSKKEEYKSLITKYLNCLNDNTCTNIK